MNATITIAIIAAVIIIAIVIAWILTANKAKAVFKDELGRNSAEAGGGNTGHQQKMAIRQEDSGIIGKKSETQLSGEIVEIIRESFHTLGFPR